MRRVAQRNRVMSEINITPLTDVMMVLLIIFMVTTPLIMKASIDIDLPKAHAKKSVTNTENIQITLSKDRKIYLNGSVVGINEIGEHLKQYFQNGQDPNVTVSADKAVTYGDAVHILDIARQAGANKLVLATEPLPIKALSEEILNQ